MITSANPKLEPELMDVVRLFSGAEQLNISHETDRRDNYFVNRFCLDGERSEFCHTPQTADDFSSFGETSLVKRYAKLALYELLRKRFQTNLPWGSLTGIRPTRLAYTETESGNAFEPLFEELGVSGENTALVKRVLEGQKGIYGYGKGNCDLFVSLPFCPTKCVYCSFVTAPIGKTRRYLPDYINALRKELQSARKLVGNLRSVYIGGGTPFALEAEELRAVFEAVAPLRENGCEYTVEAGRPDVFTREKLDLCREYGVTRICINAQSFCDETLRTIGRSHTARQVEEAFELARPYGFIVNCDLIAGLTGESVEEFCESVDKALSLNPENITVHTLCLKKGARLKEEVASLNGERLGSMIAYSRKALTGAGYEPYYLYRQKYMAGAHENVGWCKKGTASVYNVDVMEECADNLAVGANAVSKKLFLARGARKNGEEYYKAGRIERYGSPKDIPTYLNKVDKIISEKEALFSM